MMYCLQSAMVLKDEVGNLVRERESLLAEINRYRA